MKKKVTTKKDLNSMALSSGAMITDSSGKKFNSKKKTAVKKAIPEPEKRLEPVKPEPKPVYVAPPKPEPVKPDENLLVVAEKIDDASKTNAVLMAGLMEQIAKIQFQSAMPVMEWKFDFDRDKKGYLTGIHAKAITDKLTLN